MNPQGHREDPGWPWGGARNKYAEFCSHRRTLATLEREPRESKDLAWFFAYSSVDPIGIW